MKHLFSLCDNQSKANHKRIEKATQFGFIVDGKELIDISCNLSSTIIGYDRVDIIDHVTNQMKQTPICPAEIQTDTSSIKKLSDRIYGDTGCHSLFSLSGSDAIELAIRCVKLYHHKRKTNKTKIIGFNNSYHGSNQLNLQISNINPNTGREANDDDQFIHLPNINSYATAIEFEFETLNRLRKLFQQEPIACIVQETCSWGGNLLSVSDNYWKHLKQLCEQYDVLLVIDDIAMCGGKTGKLYGFNITPDVFCVGKAFGGGYFPIAAACINNRVYQEIKHDCFFAGYTHSFHLPGIIAANYYHEHILTNGILESVPNTISKAVDVCKQLDIKSFNHFGTMFSVQMHKAVDVKLLDNVFRNNGLNLGFIISLPMHDRFIWSVPLTADDEYFYNVKRRLTDCLLQI